MSKKLIRSILAIFLVLFGLGTVVVAINYTFFSPDILLVLRLVFFFLLLTDAVCYFVAAWGVAKNIKWVYPLTIILLIVNILGLIFDDFGLIDASAAVVNIIILVLLVYNHKKSN